MGLRSTMHVARLVAPKLDGEDHTKDIDFTPAGIRARWLAGYEGHEAHGRARAVDRTRRSDGRRRDPRSRQARKASFGIAGPRRSARLGGGRITEHFDAISSARARPVRRWPCDSPRRVARRRSSSASASAALV